MTRPGRPGGGPPGSGQDVGPDQQATQTPNRSTGPAGGTTLSTSVLDIPQVVQETDSNILIQIILDELEASREREARADELAELYGNLNLPDDLMGAVERPT